MEIFSTFSATSSSLLLASISTSFSLVLLLLRLLFIEYSCLFKSSTLEGRSPRRSFISLSLASMLCNAIRFSISLFNLKKMHLYGCIYYFILEFVFPESSLPFVKNIILLLLLLIILYIIIIRIYCVIDLKLNIK